MSCSDKDSDYKQETSDEERRGWESGGEIQLEKASATVPQGDTIMLTHIETSTYQDCTNQEMKDQKIAEQFRSASAPTRTKRQRKTMEEVPTEGMGRNLQEEYYRKSHELQASGREL